MLHYFAYGSNMHPQQMAERCPGARALGAGILEGWRFFITTRGTASIVPDDSSRVHGVVWRCGPPHFHALDRYEGVHWRNYARRVVTIESRAEGVLAAHTYVGFRRYPGRARANYMRTAVIPGAQAFGLPSDYIEELESWLPNRIQGPIATRYRGRTKPLRHPR